MLDNLAIDHSRSLQGEAAGPRHLGARPNHWWVLSILPTALALFIAVTNPAKYRSFYTDPFGMQMIAFALVLQVIGVIIIKIVKIED